MGDMPIMDLVELDAAAPLLGFKKSTLESETVTLLLEILLVFGSFVVSSSTLKVGVEF